MLNGAMLKRALVVVMILAGVVWSVLVFAEENAAEGSNAANADILSSESIQGLSWEPFYSVIGNFSVSFPTHPIYSQDRLPVDGGDSSVVLNTYISEPNADVAYMVMAAEFPPSIDVSNPSKNLENALNGVVGYDKNRHLLSAEFSIVQGNQALDFVVMNNGYLTRGRLILIEHTLYQIIAAYREDLNLEGSYADFVDSFDIMEGQSAASAEQ